MSKCKNIKIIIKYPYCISHHPFNNYYDISISTNPNMFSECIFEFK